MTERASIDYKDKIADYNELVKIIEESNSSLIAIKNVIIDESTLELLEIKFDDKLICYIEWSKRLLIEDSITTTFIKSHINEFLQCFIEFDSKAYEMMNKLATTFNLDLNDSTQIWDLKRKRSKNQRGEINSSWSYHFHGAECAFHNRKTGQDIDVKIIYGTEFGVINNFFLYRFIETTKSLSLQLELLEGKSHNLRKVTNVLKQEGYLVKRCNSELEELVLNRTKKRR